MRYTIYSSGAKVNIANINATPLGAMKNVLSKLFASKPSSGEDLAGAVLAAWSKMGRRKTGARCTFVLDGEPLSDEDIGRADMVLPVLLWHADRIYGYSVSGSGLGVRFLPDDKALVQVRPQVDKGFRSNTELLLFCVEAAEDAFAHLPQSRSVAGAVELRPLVNEFAKSMDLTPKPVAASRDAKPSA